MNRSHSVCLVDDEEIRKILIMKWSAMGGVALASAGIEDVYRAFPGREIHLNTLPGWAEMFRSDPRLGRVIAPDVRKKGGQMPAIVEWLRIVGAQRYDLVIDFQSSDRSRLLLSLLWLSGSQIRHRLGNRRGIPYTIAPAYRRSPVHALTIIQRTLAAAGIPAVTPRPVLRPSSQDRAKVRKLLENRELERDEFAVLLPGSQAAGWTKRWGATRYAALSSLLLRSGLKRVALLGGPDDVDECRRIVEATGDPRVVNLCGETALLDVALICGEARFVVANDTGTAHLASTAGKPMVVICGPTDPRRVRPAGDNVSTLQAQIPCINCYAGACAHHSCMKLITPDMVIDSMSR